MKTLGGMILALASFQITGTALLFSIRGVRGARQPRAAELGMAFLLGCAACFAWMLVASRLGARLSFLTLLPLVALAVLALPLLVRGRGRTRPPASPSARRPERAPLLTCALALGLAVAAASVLVGTLAEPIGEVDAVAAWAFQAKLFFHEQAVFSPWFLSGQAGTDISHWPPELPLLQAILHLAAGAYDDRMVKLLFVAFFLAMLGVTYGSILAVGRDRRRALLFTFLLASLPALIVPFPAGSVASAYADAPMAALIAAVAGALVLWQAHQDRRYLWLAGIFLAGTLWLKREGLALAASVLLGTVIVGVQDRRRRGLRATEWALLCGCVLAGLVPLLAYKRMFPGTITGDRLDPGSLATLAGLQRAGLNALLLLREAVDPSRWLLLWVATAGAIVLRSAFGGWDRAGRILAWTLAIDLVIAIAVMAAGEYSPWRIARLDSRRLLVQLAPIAIFLIAGTPLPGDSGRGPLLISSAPASSRSGPARAPADPPPA